MVQEATGGAQAEQQQGHMKSEARGIQHDEDASAKITPDGLHTSVYAVGTKQADDIFGPAHEFD